MWPVVVGLLQTHCFKVEAMRWRKKATVARLEGLRRLPSHYCVHSSWRTPLHGCLSKHFKWKCTWHFKRCNHWVFEFDSVLPGMSQCNSLFSASVIFWCFLTFFCVLLFTSFPSLSLSPPTHCCFELLALFTATLHLTICYCSRSVPVSEL